VKLEQIAGIYHSLVDWLACLVCLVDDEDEEVSGILDPDSLDPGSVVGVRGGRRTPRALSPVRRSPRPTSPARVPSPAKQGRFYSWSDVIH